MTRQKTLLTTLLVWALTSAVHAQPYCDVHTYTIHDGLASNTIAAIQQTPDDLMWFATWNGLCCYDGYRFTTFRNVPGVSEVLSNNRLLVMRTNRMGDIWCVSYDRILYLFDTRQCRFLNVNDLIQKKYGSSYRTWNIYALANGHTWVTSRETKEVFRLDDERVSRGEDAVEKYTYDATTINVALDSTGCEWIFTDRFLTTLDQRVKTTRPYHRMKQMGDALFFASDDGSLAELRGGTASLKPVALPAGVTRIKDMAQRDERTLLLATNLGVVAYDLGKRTARVISVQTPSQPMAQVDAVYVDSKHRIWAFNSGQGVTMIDAADAPHWLQSQAENPLWQTRSDGSFFHEDDYGTLWLVPSAGTFSYYDEDAQRLVPYTLKAENRLDRPLPQVGCRLIDRNGNLWFSGVRDVSLVNFRYRHFHYTPVEAGSDTRSLMIDRQGRTWAGTFTGELVVFDKQGSRLGYMSPQGRLQSQPVRFASQVYALTEDRQGRVWVGTKVTGIYLIEPSGRVSHYVHDDADPYSLSHNDVYDFDIDAAGHIWVASYRGGLNLVDENMGKVRFINCNNELRQYPMTDGYEKIRRVTHTKGGVQLLSTNYGLITFSSQFKKPADIQFHVNKHSIDDPSGLLAYDVLQSLAHRNGRCYVVTMGGGVQELLSNDLLQENLRFTPIETVEPGESMVLGVADDNSGSLWMIRESGIERYDTYSDLKYQYGQADLGNGVDLVECKPATDTVTGNVLVAVSGGYLTFNLAELKKQERIPNIVFTSVIFQGSNQMEPILNKERLDVPADSRNLSVYFSTLDYRSKDFIMYAYMIEDMDMGWTYINRSNCATFNYLPAGHHRLLVRSTNSEGVWLDNVKVLNIYVEPTFSETLWPKLLTALVVALVVALASFFYWRRRSRKAA